MVKLEVSQLHKIIVIAACWFHIQGISTQESLGTRSYSVLVVATYFSTRTHAYLKIPCESQYKLIDSIKPSFLSFSILVSMHYNTHDKQRTRDENLRVAIASIHRPFKCLEKRASIQRIS